MSSLTNVSDENPSPKDDSKSTIGDQLISKALASQVDIPMPLGEPVMDPQVVKYLQRLTENGVKSLFDKTKQIIVQMMIRSFDDGLAGNAEDRKTLLLFEAEQMFVEMQVSIEGRLKWLKRLSMSQLVMALKPVDQEVMVLPAKVKLEDDAKEFDACAKAMISVVEAMKNDRFCLLTDIDLWDQRMTNKVIQFARPGLLNERHWKAMFDQLLDQTGPHGVQVFYAGLDQSQVREDVPSYHAWRANFIDQILRHRRITVTDILEVRHRPGMNFSEYLQLIRAKLRDLDRKAAFSDYVVAQLYFRGLCEPYRGQINVDFTTGKIATPETLAGMHHYCITRFQPDIGNKGVSNDVSSFIGEAPTANARVGGGGKNSSNRNNSGARRDAKGDGVVAGAAGGGASSNDEKKSGFRAPFPENTKIADAASGSLKLYQNPKTKFTVWGTSDGRAEAWTKDQSGKFLQQCCGVYAGAGAQHEWSTCKSKVNPRQFDPSKK
jgi:hypothetical protein